MDTLAHFLTAHPALVIFFALLGFVFSVFLGFGLGAWWAMDSAFGDDETGRFGP